MERQSRSLIFLLSPAHCGGKRAGFVLNDHATFALALKIRSTRGATIGETFSFLSGLYFRGKLAYAHRFARPPRGVGGSLVITTNRGLIASSTKLSIDELRAMGVAKIDCEDPLYHEPLRRDVIALAKRWPTCAFVLLGSVATGKYVNVLLDALGERLLFPQEFVGRGDMSRGGLMLRCVEDERELTYAPVAGAVRHGARPPKLERRIAAVGTVNEGRALKIAPRRQDRQAE